MHHPTNRARCTSSWVSSLGGRSSLSEPITDRPRFRLPPGELYTKTCWGRSAVVLKPSSSAAFRDEVCTTNLSQSAQGIGQCRVGEVPLCELCHQLLKVIFKELRVWQQRLLTVRPVANVVSLEGRRAKWIRCMFPSERRDGQPHGPHCFGGVQ